MKYFVDTNVFLRVLIKESDKSYQQCLLFLEAIKTGKISGVTAGIVIAEIIWTLTSLYKIDKTKTIDIVRGVINLHGLKIIDQYDHQFALDLYAKTNVKYIDSVINSIEEIRTKKWAIVSYDKDFDKLDVIRKEPNQILGFHK